MADPIWPTNRNLRLLFCFTYLTPKLSRYSLTFIRLCALRAFQCNVTKLQIIAKIYNNKLYMLLNPSAFFKIYVYVLFLLLSAIRISELRHRIKILQETFFVQKRSKNIKKYFFDFFRKKCSFFKFFDHFTMPYFRDKNFWTLKQHAFSHKNVC